jgi:hypothetical protein
VLFDVRRVLDLLPGYRHPQVIGADHDAAQGNEGQVPADEPLLDGAELRLVGLDVDVDVLQPADLLAVAIEKHLAVPRGDVPFGVWLVLGHRREPPLRSWPGPVIHPTPA